MPQRADHKGCSLSIDRARALHDGMCRHPDPGPSHKNSIGEKNRYTSITQRQAWQSTCEATCKLMLKRMYRFFRIRNNHIIIIGTQVCPVMAECFPNTSFETIPNNRVALAFYCHAKSVMRLLVRNTINNAC